MSPSRPRRLLATLALLVCAGAALAASAGAETTLVGPPNLNGATVEGGVSCSVSCLVAQQSPSYTAPFDGVITEWQVKGTTGKVVLEVLEGNKVTGVSTTHVAAGSGKEGFTDLVPIKAGERFGIGINGGGGEIGDRKPAGTKVDIWNPIPFLGEAPAPEQSPAKIEILANVKVRPAPSVDSVTPASGPTGEENTVTIKGHNFADVHTVSFGAVSSIFEVLSETEMVAHPFAFDPGPVALTIQSAAGTDSFANAFTFTAPPAGTSTPPVTVTTPPLSPVNVDPIAFPKEPAECRVPKLKGKTLKQAKPILVAAHCRLGAVTKRKGATAGTGKVKSELPPAGARAPANHKVAVTLG